MHGPLAPLLPGFETPHLRNLAARPARRRPSESAVDVTMVPIDIRVHLCTLCVPRIRQKYCRNLSDAARLIGLTPIFDEIRPH